MAEVIRLGFGEFDVHARAARLNVPDHHGRKIFALSEPNSATSEVIVLFPDWGTSYHAAFSEDYSTFTLHHAGASANCGATGECTKAGNQAESSSVVYRVLEVEH